jgi:hypothetical protein
MKTLSFKVSESLDRKLSAVVKRRQIAKSDLGLTVAAPFIKDGKLVALAQLAPGLPGVPLAAEVVPQRKQMGPQAISRHSPRSSRASACARIENVAGLAHCACIYFLLRQSHRPPSSGRQGLENVLSDSRNTTRSLCSRAVRFNGFAGAPSLACRRMGSMLA